MNEQQQISRYVSYMYSYPHKTAYRTLTPPVSLSPYLERLEGREASLYFHIPFCAHKCGYCNLFSQQCCDAERISLYLHTMRRQAEQLSGCRTVGRVVLSGRTVRCASFPGVYFCRDFTGIYAKECFEAVAGEGSGAVEHGGAEFQ